MLEKEGIRPSGVRLFRPETVMMGFVLANMLSSISLFSVLCWFSTLFALFSKIIHSHEARILYMSIVFYFLHAPSRRRRVHRSDTLGRRKSDHGANTVGNAEPLPLPLRGGGVRIVAASPAAILGTSQSSRKRWRALRFNRRIVDSSSETSVKA